VVFQKPAGVYIPGIPMFLCSIQGSTNHHIIARPYATAMASDRVCVKRGQLKPDAVVAAETAKLKDRFFIFLAEAEEGRKLVRVKRRFLKSGRWISSIGVRDSPKTCSS
jgi:hypothetical protein